MNEINYTEELYKEFLNEAGFLDKLKGSVGLGGKKELSPNDLEVLDKNVDALLTSIASEIGSTKENLINDLTNGPSKDLITPEIIQYATQLIDLSNKINIHCNGVYGDKKSAMDRFIKNFKRLSKSVQGKPQ